MFSYGRTMWDVEREKGWREGWEEGWKEGWEEGWEEGKEEIRSRTILKVLQHTSITLPRTLVDQVVKVEDDDIYDKVIGIILTSKNTKECKIYIENLLPSA